MNNTILRRKGKFNNFRILRETAVKQTKINPKVSPMASVADDFIICPKCTRELLKMEIRNNYYMCPHCNHYFTLLPDKRIRMIVDEGSFKFLQFEMPETNPLHFEGYPEKRREAQARTSYKEAVIAGVGKIKGQKCVIAAMNNKFLMASMGIVVGEIITRAVEYAEKKKLPLIIFTASGGARMQEGTLSLMQMAKTASAINHFREKGGLYIAYYTNPTTGGVSASFAGLGDITLAEPKALIGFAGPRVIEQTIKQKLPEGFQTAEFLMEHGFVDMIVDRRDMRNILGNILRLHG